MAENIDTSRYSNKEDAIQAALDDSLTGDYLTICRNDWSSCTCNGPCRMCAKIEVVDGMNARDVMAMAAGARA